MTSENQNPPAIPNPDDPQRLKPANQPSPDPRSPEAQERDEAQKRSYAHDHVSGALRRDGA